MFELQPPQDDGLLKRSVGQWSANKHYFLRRYIDIFKTGMSKQKWDGLHYIDLFAGAGLEQIRNGPLEWGSPLIAAQSPLPFDRMHICELDSKCFNTLRERLQRFPQPNEPQMIHGNANLKVGEIVNELPRGSLSLAFLDPTGLHLHFETLRQLAVRRVDLVIFFPDHLDAMRNWDIYLEKPNSNLDRVLGTDEWKLIEKKYPSDRWAEQLRVLYQKQIRSLGYTQFEYERITQSGGRDLYILLFCSKHEQGGKFWRRIASKKPDGQKTFEFD